MDYKLGQEVYVVAEAILHNIRVKKSFQVFKGTFVSKSGELICVKVDLDSDIVRESMVCVQEDEVFDNFKKAIEAIHTAKDTVIPIFIPGPL